MNPPQTTVPDQAADIRPLLINAPIPSMTLTTVDGDPFDVNAAVRQQPTVLLFYRGSW